MSLIRRIGTSLVVLAIIACGSDTISAAPAGFPHAFAQITCGPADGPAIVFYLARDPAESPVPPTPYVRVYLARSVEELDGREWSVAGSNSEGGAWLNRTPDTSEAATSGNITVTTSSSGTAVEGMVDLVFPSIGHIHESFQGPVLPNDKVCV